MMFNSVVCDLNKVALNKNNDSVTKFNPVFGIRSCCSNN